MLSQPFTIVDDTTFAYLFAHECQRVFADKLINDNDKNFVLKNIKEGVKAYLNL